MIVCRTPEEVRTHLLNRLSVLRAQHAGPIGDKVDKRIVQARIAGIEEALECVQSLIDNSKPPPEPERTPKPRRKRPKDDTSDYLALCHEIMKSSAPPRKKGGKS